MFSLANPFAKQPENSFPDFWQHITPAAAPVEDARAFQLLQGFEVCALHEREDFRKLDAGAIEPLRVGDDADHDLNRFTTVIADLIGVTEFHRSDRKGLFKITLLAAMQRIFYWRAATGAGTTQWGKCDPRKGPEEISHEKCATLPLRRFLTPTAKSLRAPSTLPAAWRRWTFPRRCWLRVRVSLHQLGYAAVHGGTDAHWICALTVASFEPRMRCQCCRQRRAAVMPNWNERRAPNAASYFIPGRA
jgi:hypothetical protein